MTIADFEIKWPNTIALILLTAFLFWGFACPPTVTSLHDPTVKITRPELQIELDTLIATAEYKLASLDEQQQLRDVIFENATQMVTTGQINPVGIMTLLAGLYGLTRAGKDVKDKVIAKKNSTKPPDNTSW